MLTRVTESNSIDRDDVETLARKVGAFVLTIGSFVLAVGLAMVARSFVFDYFHGNRAAAQAFARLLFGS